MTSIWWIIEDERGNLVNRTASKTRQEAWAKMVGGHRYSSMEEMIERGVRATTIERN